MCRVSTHGKAMNSVASLDALLAHSIPEVEYVYVADAAAEIAHQYLHALLSALRERGRVPNLLQSTRELSMWRKAEQLHVVAMIAMFRMGLDYAPLLYSLL